MSSPIHVSCEEFDECYKNQMIMSPGVKRMDHFVCFTNAQHSEYELIIMFMICSHHKSTNK